MTRTELINRIDRWFEQLRHDRPPLIGTIESPQRILADVREHLAKETDR